MPRPSRSGPRSLGALIALLVLVLLPAASAQRLTVAAASSLTDAFGALAEAFEASAAGAGEPLALSFGSSSTLATQILQGAPFAVFASADETQMARVEAAGLTAAPPRIVATNRLVLLVREGSGAASLDDLARPGVLLVLAAPQVPAGAYAAEALRRAAAAPGAARGDAWLAALERNVVSREPNVRQVAAKVALGEADAALVYATDALDLAGVRVVELPGGISPVARYPLAPLADAADGARAVAFVDFALSDAGQAILAGFGFAPPPAGPTR